MKYPDIIYDPEPICKDLVCRDLADFGIPIQQLLEATGGMLAGGAAANIFYNYLNPENPKPLDPNADLDFWVYDPHIDRVGTTARHHVVTLFQEALSAAGYVKYQRHPAIAVWYQQAFAVQGNTRIRCNWWAHPVTGKRIQLIFTSTPPEQTLMNFDLPVCRAALTAPQASHFALQWTGQAEKVMRDRLMLTPPLHEQTPLLAYRIAKYAERYNIKLFSSNS